MNGIQGYERNGIGIVVMHMRPQRKKPVLAVKIDNGFTKVASFNSEETADWFLEILEEFIHGNRKDVGEDV